MSEKIPAMRRRRDRGWHHACCVRRSRIPLRKSRGRAMRGYGPPEYRSMSDFVQSRRLTTMPDISGGSGQAPARHPQARGVQRRKDRCGRRHAGRHYGRGGQSAGASVARTMQRHSGRHRHRAGRRSSLDLPASRHGNALAGARGAGSRAAYLGHQPAGPVRARNTAVGDGIRSCRSACSHETRRRGRAGHSCSGRTGQPRARSSAVLRELSDRGITRLLVEGGARVAASFVTADLVDEAWLLRGPDPIGDDGVAALGALPLTAITEFAEVQGSC